ncbi:ATP-dependent zinc metalloprotease FtsH [Shouchella lonarensis]|uniref:ATP-dependent zinc metalloprotease FtsH n=1 Tax=Shouchella lonarensis TaxID=1464122 RepID=A0A1G6NVA3_9BACI|nr:ATP-dependent zinc metalloprotease FtsH [Shouchella lonarensis]SDC71075.1 membrane protease FtsH catalytic subunit [Shouchella lonarensis]
MNRTVRTIIIFTLLLLIVMAAVQSLSGDRTETKEVRTDEFLQRLDKGEVKSVEVKPERSVFIVTGRFTDSKKDERFETHLLNSEVTKDMLLQLENVDLTVKPEDQQSNWLSTVLWFAPLLLVILIIFFLMSSAQGGGGGGGNRVMNFGKSKAKMVSDDKKKAKFKDVAGADEEKQELVEVVDFLKDPRKFVAIGARIPKGVLLVGPPGTGKTLLARAVAGEAGVPFFSISGSDFVEMFVGVGASRVRDLFENAKKNSPCIIFIDEIDAVGRQRGAGLGGGHDEREQTLNQLLVEMDGFSSNEGIIIIAATNRADILDPALLRPGRFDRQIQVNAPDVKGREEVLRVHARNKPLREDVKLDLIAARTPGFSGADLENLLNEAALVAARGNKTEVGMEHVEEAIDRVIAGPAKKSRVISPKEKNIVAWHEAGHTVVGVKLESADMVHKVTIIPRGMAGGYAMMLPKEDRYFMTKPELLDKIVGLLGGRVAEEIQFGEVSTGAHNDFQRATAIARKMVAEYGMSDKIGPVQFGSNGGGQVFLGRDIQNEQNYSDAIAHDIDLEVQRILKESYTRCKEIILENKDSLDLIAQKLLELETLDAEQIQSLINEGKLPENHHATKKLTDVKVNIQSKDDEATGEPYEETTNLPDDQSGSVDHNGENRS